MKTLDMSLLHISCDSIYMTETFIAAPMNNGNSSIESTSLLVSIDGKFETFMNALSQEFAPTSLRLALVSAVQSVLSSDPFESSEQRPQSDRTNATPPKFWSLFTTGCWPCSANSIAHDSYQQDTTALLTTHLPSILVQLFYHDITSSSRFTYFDSQQLDRRRLRPFLYPKQCRQDVGSWWMHHGSTLLAYILVHFSILLLADQQSRDPKQTYSISWEKDVVAFLFNKVQSANYGRLYGALAHPADGMGTLKSFHVGAVAFLLDTMIVSSTMYSHDTYISTQAMEIYPCRMNQDTIAIVDVSSRCIQQMFYTHSLVTHFMIQLHDYYNDVFELLTDIADTLVSFTRTHVQSSSIISLEARAIMILIRSSVDVTVQNYINNLDHFLTPTSESTDKKRKLAQVSILAEPEKYMRPLLTIIETYLLVPDVHSALSICQSLDRTQNVDGSTKQLCWFLVLQYFKDRGALFEDNQDTPDTKALNRTFHLMAVNNTSLWIILEYLRNIIADMVQYLNSHMSVLGGTTIEEADWVRYHQFQVLKTSLKFCLNRKANFLPSSIEKVLAIAKEVSCMTTSSVWNDSALVEVNNILSQVMQRPPEPDIFRKGISALFDYPQEKDQRKEDNALSDRPSLSKPHLEETTSCYVGHVDEDEKSNVMNSGVVDEDDVLKVTQARQQIHTHVDSTCIDEDGEEEDGYYDENIDELEASGEMDSDFDEEEDGCYDKDIDELEESGEMNSDFDEEDEILEVTQGGHIRHVDDTGIDEDGEEEDGYYDENIDGLEETGEIDSDVDEDSEEEDGYYDENIDELEESGHIDEQDESTEMNSDVEEQDDVLEVTQVAHIRHVDYTAINEDSEEEDEYYDKNIDELEESSHIDEKDESTEINSDVEEQDDVLEVTQVAHIRHVDDTGIDEDSEEGHGNDDENIDGLEETGEIDSAVYEEDDVPPVKQLGQQQYGQVDHTSIDEEDEKEDAYFEKVMDKGKESGGMEIIADSLGHYDQNAVTVIEEKAHLDDGQSAIQCDGNGIDNISVRSDEISSIQSNISKAFNKIDVIDDHACTANLQNDNIIPNQNHVIDRHQDQRLDNIFDISNEIHPTETEEKGIGRCDVSVHNNEGIGTYVVNEQRDSYFIHEDRTSSSQKHDQESVLEEPYHDGEAVKEIASVDKNSNIDINYQKSPAPVIRRSSRKRLPSSKYDIFDTTSLGKRSNTVHSNRLQTPRGLPSEPIKSGGLSDLTLTTGMYTDQEQDRSLLSSPMLDVANETIEIKSARALKNNDTDYALAPFRKEREKANKLNRGNSVSSHPKRNHRIRDIIELPSSFTPNSERSTNFSANTGIRTRSQGHAIKYDPSVLLSASLKKRLVRNILPDPTYSHDTQSVVIEKETDMDRSIKPDTFSTTPKNATKKSGLSTTPRSGTRKSARLNKLSLEAGKENNSTAESTSSKRQTRSQKLLD